MKAVNLSGLCSDSGGSSLSAGSVPGAAVFQGDRGRCCIPQAERAEKGKEDRVFKRSAQ